MSKRKAYEGYIPTEGDRVLVRFGPNDSVYNSLKGGIYPRRNTEITAAVESCEEGKARNNRTGWAVRLEGDYDPVWLHKFPVEGDAEIVLLKAVPEETRTANDALRELRKALIDGDKPGIAYAAREYVKAYDLAEWKEQEEQDATDQEDAEAKAALLDILAKAKGPLTAEERRQLYEAVPSLDAFKNEDLLAG